MSQAQGIEFTGRLPENLPGNGRENVPEAPVADLDLEPRVAGLEPEPRVAGLEPESRAAGLEPGPRAAYPERYPEREAPATDSEHEPPQAEMPHPRAAGSPLQMGASRRQPMPAENGAGGRIKPPEPGRALSGATPAATAEPSSLQRIVNVVRAALPIVQRLLPLLDGNIATGISNLIAPPAQPPAPLAPKIDLAPIEDRVAELRIQHRGLRDQIMEQNTSLKRVEDQLDMVREATDRNTLEQQELLEDLKAFGNKVKLVAIITLGLVFLGIAVNLYLVFRIKSIFP